MYDNATQGVLGQPFIHNGPHVLADFLNPGREFWGQFEQRHIKAALGLTMREPTQQELRDHASMLAANGFNVVNFSAMTLDAPIERFNAGDSWNTSVPADLRP